MNKWVTFCVLLIMSVSTVQATVFNVDAFVNSSSGGSGAATGIFFTAGESFSASADVNDLWSAGALPRWSNADGLTGARYATGTDESGQLAGTLIGADFGIHTQYGLSLAYGTLVGSIDNNFFSIGTSFAGTAIASGELKLWYWDSNFSDNSEFITLTVTTAATPEPASLLLAALGLSLLGWRRRQAH